MANFVRYKKLFRLYEFIQPHLKYSLPVEKELPGKKVLVIAPHPDDETIGCGGTIYKHINSGGSAEVLYCTLDSDIRFKEAMNAASVIGFSNKHFLKYQVESLAKQHNLADKFYSLFKKIDPDIVFVPFWFDNHTDHRAVNSALRKVAKRKTFNFMIYSYPVWFPLYPNVLIDIGDVWEKKKEAIQCYPSQLATRDYVKMSHSLGQYWAEVKGRGLEVVESFFRASFSEYVSLGKKMGI
ncbi:MAG: PIG-L family deacetylase [Elusimicrobia bacterium]|nr:PIG-L family deacetylase [Elusimicrobiota bacterium]